MGSDDKSGADVSHDAHVSPLRSRKNLPPPPTTPRSVVPPPRHSSPTHLRIKSLQSRAQSSEKSDILQETQNVDSQANSISSDLSGSPLPQSEDHGSSYAYEDVKYEDEPNDHDFEFDAIHFTEEGEFDPMQIVASMESKGL